MDAGYADVDITPEPGEELAGWGFYLNRRAAGTMDPLLARAMALGDGETKVVIVQLDLIGLTKEIVADVRAEAERRFRLQPDHLMLHCTHTHSGPAVYHTNGCGTPSEQFLISLRDSIVEVIGEALEDLRPANALRRFEGNFADGFAFNQPGKPDIDTALRGLWIEFADARPILVIHYACHPVTLGPNNEYSADFPGAVIREFNAYGTRALYINGPFGDIKPLSLAYKREGGTRETLLIYGRDMACAVREAMEQMQEWKPGPLRAVSRMVPLEAEVPALEELERGLQEARQTLADDSDDPMLRVDVRWHENILVKHQTGAIRELMQAEVQAIACGDVVFVGLGMETFTRLGQVIRHSAPDHHLIIGDTSNGILGYVATTEDVEEGGYSSLLACKILNMLPPLPGAGEKWATEAAGVVAEVIDQA